MKLGKSGSWSAPHDLLANFLIVRKPAPYWPIGKLCCRSRLVRKPGCLMLSQGVWTCSFNRTLATQAIRKLVPQYLGMLVLEFGICRHWNKEFVLFLYWITNIDASLVTGIAYSPTTDLSASNEPIHLTIIDILVQASIMACVGHSIWHHFALVLIFYYFLYWNIFLRMWISSIDPVSSKMR